jgi:dienelactone hydrolase
MKKNHGNSYIKSMLVSGLIFFLASLCQPLFAQSNATDYKALGSFAVETRLENWTDPARERTLPVKLYLPTGAPAGPVVIFSHGLGGSRESAAYLGTHWASHGIVGVFIQHPGTDKSVWSHLKDATVFKKIRIIRALAQAAKDKQAAISRFTDIPFIVNKLQTLITAGALKGDPARIGMAGHSYGARSTLTALGRGYVVEGNKQTMAEPRIVAGLALSPEPVTETDQDTLNMIYGGIKTPIFHITGTKDAPPLGLDGEPEDRQKPFHLIPAKPQLLMVFKGADHMVFAGTVGLKIGPSPAWYKDVQSLTAAFSTAWWKAQLSEDESAKAWLAEGSAKSVLRAGDVINSKE